MDAAKVYKSALLSEAKKHKTVNHTSSRTTSQLPLPVTSARLVNSSMDMKLGLGAKAKLALADSLNHLNSKLRLGTFPGVVQNQSTWSSSEMRVWMSVLFVGVVCLYGNQIVLPMTVVEVEEQLTWQRKHTALLLSSFYWGSLLTQLFGSRLSEKFGGGVVMYLAAGVWAVGVVCVSFAAYVSMSLAIFVRVLTGMAQGLHYPALLNLIVHRAPESGKAFFFNVLNTGAFVGCALAGVLESIVVIDHGLNWYYLSVMTATLAMVWVVSLRAITLHSLQNHKTHYKLSEGKRYTSLVSSASTNETTSSAANGVGVMRPSSGGSGSGRGLGAGGRGLSVGGGSRDSSRERLKLDVHPGSMVTSCTQLPVRNLLRQPPVLALLSAHFAISLFLHNMICWNSVYFNDLFPQRKDQSWLYNVLPWIAMAMGSGVSSWTSEWMTSHNFSQTMIRNIFTSLSLGLSSFFLILLTIAGHNKGVHFSLTVFFSILTFLCLGCYSAGPLANLFDLVTPSQAASLFTVVTTVSTIPGIFGVYLTGCIVQATSSWALVFSILIITNIVATLVYLAFSSGKRLQLSDT